MWVQHDVMLSTEQHVRHEGSLPCCASCTVEHLHAGPSQMKP
jgi:hypothetical protein